MQVALPQGVAADARIAAMCPITCALHGVYAAGCAPPPAPPAPPTPPLPPGAPPMPPAAPIPQCELSACRARGGYDSNCCDIFRHVDACAPGYDRSFVLPVSAGGNWDPLAAWEQAATGTTQPNEFCWLYNGLGNTCCSPAAPRLPPSPPVAPPPPLPPPFTSGPPLVPGALVVSSLSELRSNLNVASKEPLHLQLPEGAHFALGGFPLEVFHRNLTLRSTGSGATLDGEFLSQLLTHGCPYCFNGVCDNSCTSGWCECHTTVKLHNIHLVNGRDWVGGAIQSLHGTRAELTNCTIESCGAMDGGAIYVGDRASLTLTDSTIAHCRADLGGAISLYGGSKATLLNSRITSCSSKTHGGGVNLQDVYSESPGMSLSVYREGGVNHSNLIVWRVKSYL